jgi:hypothetical protein
MKDSLYNAIIFYLIIVVGLIFIKHPIFFNSGYDLRVNKSLVLPNFVIFIILLAFCSLYIGRKYT